MKIKYVGKCLLLETEGTKLLVIGDLHLGIEEALNRTGVYVSEQIMKEMLDELDVVFERIGKVDTVVLLGDVKHEFGTIERQEWRGAETLFEYLEEKTEEIVIVKGNHDTILEPIVRNRTYVQMKETYCVGEVCFVHGDKDYEELYDKAIEMWIMGHGHPAIKISDGVKVEKFKCFLVGNYKGKKIIVVPSFTTHNEGSDPRENDLGLTWPFALEKFNVNVVGEKLDVLDFGKLGKLK